MNEPSATLYLRLNARRIRDGLSWRALARLFDVSPSTLSRMQHGGWPDGPTTLRLDAWASERAAPQCTHENLVCAECGAVVDPRRKDERTLAELVGKVDELTWRTG